MPNTTHATSARQPALAHRARPHAAARRLHARWRATRRILDARYLKDAWIAADPGLTRLTGAVRATSSGILAGLVLELLLGLAHQPGPLLIIGVGIGTMSTLWVNDATARAQALTTALLPLQCMLGLVLGSLCSSNASAASLGFVAVTFAAVYARRYGPRGNALGMGLFLSFVYALFLNATPSKLPWMGVCIVVAIACNFSARFVLLRDRPERTERRLHAAFDAAARMLLRRYADALASRDWQAERRGALVGLANLNAIALALEDVAAERTSAVDASKGSECFFVVELALQRLAASCPRALAAPYDPALLGVVAEALRQVRGTFGLAQARPTLCATESVLARLTPHGAEGKRLVADVRELCGALAGWSTDVASDAQLAAWNPPSASASAPTRDPRSIARQALQAALAAGMASAVGRLLSYTRWYWAVLASFVIFSRASSRGDTLIRGAHRVVGTLLGLGAGLALVRLAHARPAIALPLLFAMLFIGTYFLRVSYVLMVACITCALALLYGVLGRPTAELLHVRLEETAAGVAIGMLVSLCILPIRTRPLIFARMAEVLRSIRAGLEQVASWLEGGRWEQGPIAAARAVDRARQRLREAAAPFTGRLASLAVPRLTREMLIVSALVYETREFLHQLALRAPALEPAAREHLAAELRACSSELEQLNARLSSESSPLPSAADPQAPERVHEPASAGASCMFTRVSRLDEVVRDLQQALAEGSPGT